MKLSALEIDTFQLTHPVHNMNYIAQRLQPLYFPSLSKMKEFYLDLGRVGSITMRGLSDDSSLHNPDIKSHCRASRTPSDSLNVTTAGMRQYVL